MGFHCAFYTINSNKYVPIKCVLIVVSRPRLYLILAGKLNLLTVPPIAILFELQSDKVHVLF